MGLSKRKRFEVFKRDRFTCQYCGAKAPDVVLEVDHIHPVAEGGDDNEVNLTTACFGCNRGKSDRLVGEHGETLKAEAIENRVERMEQLRELNAMLSVERDQEDDYLRDLGSYFWNRNDDEGYTFTSSQLGSIRPYARKLNVNELKDLMDSTWRRDRKNYFAYFIACCRTRLEMKEAGKDLD